MSSRASGSQHRRRLRLISFNIQTGTPTDSYRKYFTESWRQLLPSSQRVDNLDAISGLVSEYDMVALQEVDSGSLRSGFINQSRYIATHSSHPFWFHQSNRKVGNMAYPGIGFIARHNPEAIVEHRLPGALPGRGALVLEFGGEEGLTVAVVHLALGPNARRQQLRYLAQHLAGRRALIVMGDLNARADSRHVRDFRDALDLAAPTAELNSYPAWKPRRPLDHILVSRNIRSIDAQALQVAYSDHLPVAVTVELPPGMMPAGAGEAPLKRLASGV